MNDDSDNRRLSGHTLVNVEPLSTSIGVLGVTDVDRKSELTICIVIVCTSLAMVLIYCALSASINGSMKNSNTPTS